MSGKIIVPGLGESILEATIARWIKKPGEAVQEGEPLVELETEKVNLEVRAEQAGILTTVLHNEGDDVRVGDILGEIDSQESIPAAQNKQPPETQPESHSQTGQNGGEKAGGRSTVSVSPVAQRVADELNIPIEDIQGSGPGGRILRKDVEKQVSPAPPVANPAGPAGASSGDQAPVEIVGPALTERQPAAGRFEERIRMSRRRRTIAQKLVEAQHTAAILTTFNDVDMQGILDLRQRWKEPFKTRHGVGLGIVSFFVKASVIALIDFPRMNAELQGDEIVLKKYYDIGVAVAADEGLVVPVLRDAERLRLVDIEKKIHEFSDKARSNTFTLEDLRGGTFSITNGGVFGSLLSTPILSPPQVGILGLHRIEPRPVARNDQVLIRPMMYLALSYDHRIIDGKEAVQFLVRVKEIVENPEMLLIDG